MSFTFIVFIFMYVIIFIRVVAAPSTITEGYIKRIVFALAFGAYYKPYTSVVVPI